MPAIFSFIIQCFALNSALKRDQEYKKDRIVNKLWSPTLFGMSATYTCVRELKRS